MRAKIEPNTYLGDGVYCLDEGGTLQLYTSNGKDVLSRIYLDPEVLLELVRFARHRGYTVDR
jgi:hypothetical protein